MSDYPPLQKPDSLRQAMALERIAACLEYFKKKMEEEAEKQARRSRGNPGL